MNLKDCLFINEQGQRKGEKRTTAKSISQHHLESQRTVDSVEQQELEHKCLLIRIIIRNKLSHLVEQRKLSGVGQPTEEEDGDNLR